jgi:plasmid stabilization system protein ParE
LDISTQTLHLLQTGGGALAARYIDAVEAALRVLQDFPAAGSPCRFDARVLRTLRVKLVPGFPNYLIYFRVQRRAVQVVRVLHAAQDRDRELLRGR